MAKSFGRKIRPNPPIMRRLARSCLVALALLANSPCSPSPGAEPKTLGVDLELVLAVDVSSSMSLSEQGVQRDGYVSAFRHPDLARAIASGPHGMIAVSYVDWAGPTYQRVVLPWTISLAIPTQDGWPTPWQWSLWSRGQAFPFRAPFCQRVTCLRIAVRQAHAG